LENTVLPEPLTKLLVKMSPVPVTELPLPMTVVLFKNPPVVLALLPAPKTDAIENPVAVAVLPGPSANAIEVRSVVHPEPAENPNAEAQVALAVALWPRSGAAAANDPAATAAITIRLPYEPRVFAAFATKCRLLCGVEFEDILRPFRRCPAWRSENRSIPHEH